MKRSHAIHVPAALVAAHVLGGCFSSSGSLYVDSGLDPGDDTLADTSEWVTPDGDDADGHAGDMPDTAIEADADEDAGLDADAPVDPPPDVMDVVDVVDTFDAADVVDVADTADFVDPDWECTTVYGDPACDDGNECTGDWCDMSLHTCTHSGATMEGTGCTDDGNICTSDSCHGGICGHTATREGEFCPDDGNTCTQDLCASGICTHPGTPMDGTPCASDSEICTDDRCAGGTCAHTPITGCCHTDGACIDATHVWECNTTTSTCYEPPQRNFCEPCSSRSDCGDGGTTSDDYCIYYGPDPGCSKDCRTISDCPRGSECIVSSGSTACTASDPTCVCSVLVGNCDTWNGFGDACEHDWDCDGPESYCFGTYCSFDCGSNQDCPLSATAGCVLTTCRT